MTAVDVEFCAGRRPASGSARWSAAEALSLAGFVAALTWAGGPKSLLGFKNGE